MAQSGRNGIGSTCLAAGCEDSHDLVYARLELGDRERLLKIGEWGRVLTRRLVMLDAPPLRMHRDSFAGRAAMEAGKNKARGGSTGLQIVYPAIQDQPNACAS